MTTSSILIVDKDPAVYGQYHSLLHDSAFTTEVVPSDEEARLYLERHKADIIIADLSSLGTDSQSFISYARALVPKPDLIFIASEQTVSTAIQNLKAGARDYLLKPFPPEQISHLVKSCIDQRRLLDENFQLKKQLRLYQRGQKIASLIDIEQLFPLTVSTLIDEIGQGRGFAFMFHDNDITRIDGNEGVNHEEAQILARKLLPLLQSDERLLILKGEEITGLQLPGDQYHIKTIYLFPLTCEKHIKGGVVLFNSPYTDFSPTLQAENLIFLSGQACLSFENAFRFQGARELIYTDDLTGLYNYRYLQKVLDHEIHRSERYKLSFSLIFIDLDRFKIVNDTRGHLIGSDVLRECADLLRTCVREVDVIFRYGGDEFTVLLVESPEQGAAVVAERIRSTIEGFHFQQASGTHLRLTATIGYATYPENAHDKKSILEMADRAMYRGKSQRNIVRGVWEVDSL